MMKTIEVVDNFHPDPEAVRSNALGLDWRAANDGDRPWHGSQLAPSPLDGRAAARIRLLLGPETEHGRVGISRSFFSIAGAGSADPGVSRLEDSEWAAMVWLCPPGRCRGGVSLYQPSGFDADAQGGTDSWEETMFIPARFNRMVLVRSTALFRPAAGYGQGPGSGPLTQVILANA